MHVLDSCHVFGGSAPGAGEAAGARCAQSGCSTLQACASPQPRCALPPIPLLVVMRWLAVTQDGGARQSVSCEAKGSSEQAGGIATALIHSRNQVANSMPSLSSMLTQQNGALVRASSAPFTACSESMREYSCSESIQCRSSKFAHLPAFLAGEAHHRGIEHSTARTLSSAAPARAPCH